MGGRLKEITDTQGRVSRSQGSRLTGGVRRPQVRRESTLNTSGSGGSTQSARTNNTTHVVSSTSTQPEATELQQDDSETSELLIGVAAEAPVLASHDVPTAPVHDLEAVADYWYALSHVGGVFRLDSEKYVFQDWDTESALFKVRNVNVWQQSCTTETSLYSMAHTCTSSVSLGDPESTGTRAHVLSGRPYTPAYTNRLYIPTPPSLKHFLTSLLCLSALLYSSIKPRLETSMFTPAHPRTGDTSRGSA